MYDVRMLTQVSRHVLGERENDVVIRFSVRPQEFPRRARAGGFNVHSDMAAPHQVDILMLFQQEAEWCGLRVMDNQNVSGLELASQLHGEAGIDALEQHALRVGGRWL